MTNNDIMKKLRVALHLRNIDIVHILGLVDFLATESELTAFFRSEDHDKYKPMGDQMLRNFLNGLVIHMRGPMDPKKAAEKDAAKEAATKKDFKKPYPSSDKKGPIKARNDGFKKPMGQGRTPSKVNFSSSSLKRSKGPSEDSKDKN